MGSAALKRTSGLTRKLRIHVKYICMYLYIYIYVDIYIYICTDTRISIMHATFLKTQTQALDCELETDLCYTRRFCPFAFFACVGRGGQLFLDKPWISQGPH